MAVEQRLQGGAVGQCREVTGEGRLKLPNDNFDVGEFTPPGKYRMNDEAHATLIEDWTYDEMIGAYMHHVGNSLTRRFGPDGVDRGDGVVEVVYGEEPASRGQDVLEPD